jgi:spore maturation protein CgeB
MRIAFFGSSLVSAYWNGAATYYRGIIKALHKRGHEVVFYEPDAYDRQKHRDIADPDYSRVWVYSAENTDGVYRALEHANTFADMVVKNSGVGVFDDLLEAEVLNLRTPGRLIVFWDVDAPATLERVHANPTDPFAALIPQYDMVLTYGGGHPVESDYESLGARRCVSIYNALDPETHHPTEPDPRFAADLGFLANRLPDREKRVEEFFLHAAQELPHMDFLIGGNGWDDKPMPSNVRKMGHVYTRDHNAFNCTPCAVLNVARESMARYGFSPATRVFEAAGAGACLIPDEWVGVETFLEPGREILVARDGREVARHLSRLTDAESRAIGERARARVLAHHTYDHRAEQFEALIAGVERVS